MSIVAVEDHLISKTKAMFGGYLNKVQVLPNALNLGVLKTMLPAAPAVYFAFLGGSAGEGDARINGRFDAYVITRHVGNDEARRRGDSTTIGAYDIIQGLIPELHGSTVDGVGTLQFKSVSNLFSIQLEETFKAAFYALSFELPNMPFPDVVDDTLENFITYHAEHSMTEGDKEPLAIDELTLPQE
ncbi:MAG: phage protein Gp37 [Cycloclasticus sp.]